MPLGGKDVTPVVAALERHKKFMRGEIAHMINMKFAPEIRFRIDESFENAAKIDALLARPEVRRDVDKDEAETGGEA
jgi:ribosome-binding factor A